MPNESTISSNCEVLDYNTWWETQPDARDFGPYWLDGLQGTRSEERRSSRPQYSVKAYKRLRRIEKQTSIKCLDILVNPDLLNIQLSQFGREYPDDALNLRITKFERVISEGKGRYKRLLDTFIFLKYHLQVEEWLFEFLGFAEKFRRVLRKRCFDNPRFNELYRVIELYYGTTPAQFRQILNEIYQPSQLQDKYIRGKKMVKVLEIHLIDSRLPKEKIRRRGYSHSAKKDSEAEKERRDCMNNIERENELLREEILNKQLKLFKENLDLLLELSSQDIPKKAKQSLLRHHIDETDSRLLSSSSFDLSITKGGGTQDE